MTARIPTMPRAPNEKLRTEPSYNEIVQQQLDAFERHERALSREDRREREQKLMGYVSRSKPGASDRDHPNRENVAGVHQIASARGK
jgi:hypothetical protein